jgi:hypothetical protein
MCNRKRYCRAVEVPRVSTVFIFTVELFFSMTASVRLHEGASRGDPDVGTGCGARAKVSHTSSAGGLGKPDPSPAGAGEAPGAGCAGRSLPGWSGARKARTRGQKPPQWSAARRSPARGAVRSPADRRNKAPSRRSAPSRPERESHRWVRNHGGRSVGYGEDAGGPPGRTPENIARSTTRMGPMRNRFC